MFLSNPPISTLWNHDDTPDFLFHHRKVTDYEIPVCDWYVWGRAPLGCWRFPHINLNSSISAHRSKERLVFQLPSLALVKYLPWKEKLFLSEWFFHGWALFPRQISFWCISILTPSKTVYQKIYDHLFYFFPLIKHICSWNASSWQC